jgi:hypothetical protein
MDELECFRAFGDAPQRSAKLVPELAPQSRSLLLIPDVGFSHIGLGRRAK